MALNNNNFHSLKTDHDDQQFHQYQNNEQFLLQFY